MDQIRMQYWPIFCNQIELTKNDVMRQKIKNEMNELKFAIDAAIEDMPRRKIRMAS